MNEGFGRHFWNVPLSLTLSDPWLKVRCFLASNDKSNIPLQLSYISDWFANVAYIYVKLTFFILYWNIFKPFRWLKFGILGGAVIITGLYIGFTLASLIGGSPRPGQSWRQSSNAIGIRLSVPLAAWTLVSDVFILILPISGVLRLKLSPKRKLGLSMIFMTGIGACVCSSLSLYYRTLLDSDVTYSVVNIQVLAIIELCVGIYITCMPATSVFLRHILPSMKSFRSEVISYSNKLHISLPLRLNHTSHVSNSHKSRTAGIDGPYRNLGGRELAVNDNEAYDLALHPAQAVKTKVVAESPFGEFSDDRIHLKVDLEQG